MKESAQVSLIVVGGINADLLIRVPRLPGRGESVAGGPACWMAGGKGANQAIAAARLGARVAMHGAVGEDAAGDLCLAAMKAEGIDVGGVARLAVPTGQAVVLVEEASGENQIVVALGANQGARFEADGRGADAILCQLEIPDDAILAAGRGTGLLCLNASPARPLPEALWRRVDLLIVNQHEHACHGHPVDGLVAVTAGAEPAVLWRDGRRIAVARPPRVTPVDTVGAGDTFAAALALALAGGWQAQAALDWACHAAALSTLARGAQAGMPTAAAVRAFMDRTGADGVC